MIRALLLSPTVPSPLPCPPTPLQPQWSPCCSINLLSTFPPKKFASAVPSSWCISQIGLGLLPQVSKTSLRGPFADDAMTLPLSHAILVLFWVWGGGFPIAMLPCYIRLFTGPSEPHLLEYMPLDSNFYTDSGLTHLTCFGKWDTGQGHGSRGLRGAVQQGVLSWNPAASTREGICLSCWKDHGEENQGTLTNHWPCELSWTIQHN